MPIPPKLEFLDEAPVALNRPLQLIRRFAYAATWRHVRKTTTEISGKNGEIVRLTPPQCETIRELHVVRSDGNMFGPAGKAQFAKLDFEIQLGEPPREEKMWRA